MSAMTLDGGVDANTATKAGEKCFGVNHARYTQGVYNLIAARTGEPNDIWNIEEKISLAINALGAPALYHYLRALFGNDFSTQPGSIPSFNAFKLNPVAISRIVGTTHVSAEEFGQFFDEGVLKNIPLSGSPPFVNRGDVASHIEGLMAGPYASFVPLCLFFIFDAAKDEDAEDALFQACGIFDYDD